MGRIPDAINRLSVSLALTPDERKALEDLYDYEGAWTEREARLRCPRYQDLLKAGVLVSVRTFIGTLHLLSLTGRQVLFRNAAGTNVAPQRHLDRAYLRLCMEDYGYLPVDDDTRAVLKPFIGKLNLSPMITPQGVALVGGAITGGGLSRTTTERLVTRLKSSALAHRFRVILFTPSLTRGQGLAQTHASMLTVISYLPGGGSSERAQLTTFNPGSSEEYAGPALTPIIRDMFVRKHPGLFPEQTLTLLGERRADRIEQFKTDLQVDRVISAEQLRRHYFLSPNDLKNVRYVEAIMRPVHGRVSLEIKTRFYLIGAALQRVDDNVLAHYAGTGEMRRIMNVPADEKFMVNTRKRVARDDPDAVFQSPYGPIAFEYDSGSYKLEDVQSKFESFGQQDYLQTIWGTANHNRVPTIEKIMREEEGLKGQVILSEWWRGLPSP